MSKGIRTKEEEIKSIEEIAKDRFIPKGKVSANVMIFQSQLAKLYVETVIEEREKAKQEARVEAIGFLIWATSYFDCEDFQEQPLWNGLWQGKSIVNFTTEQLYNLYKQQST